MTTTKATATTGDATATTGAKVNNWKDKSGQFRR
jgi:hypothetical protein